MKRKRSFFCVLRTVLIVLFSVIFIVSAVMLIVNICERRKSEKIYNELEEIFYDGGFDHKKLTQILVFKEDNGPISSPDAVDLADGSDDVADEEKNELLEQMREGLLKLSEINPDIYAWIFIEGTSIDYPVVLGDDNDHYLNHAYNGTYSPYGSIFADCRSSDSVADNYNTVFYGHNLLTGGSDMFHDIEMFLERDFFDAALIYVYTFDGIYVYKPFSVYQARYDYNYFEVNFDTDEAFVSFLSSVKENSRFSADVSFEESDRILTLSTCTNIEYFTRYALHAKLIYRIEY